MGLQHYTLANFRKSTKEAFDNAEDGHPTFITRHNKRYELRLAPIQGYAAQEEAIKAREAAKIIHQVSDDKRAMPAFDPDPMSVFDEPLPEKKFASDADASYDRPLDLGDSSPILMTHLKKARVELNKIDIDTQDPDEIERGSELAALIGEIEDELTRRGVK